MLRCDRRVDHSLAFALLVGRAREDVKVLAASDGKSPPSRRDTLDTTPDQAVQRWPRAPRKLAQAAPSHEPLDCGAAPSPVLPPVAGCSSFGRNFGARWTT